MMRPPNQRTPTLSLFLSGTANRSNKSRRLTGIDDNAIISSVTVKEELCCWGLGPGCIAREFLFPGYAGITFKAAIAIEGKVLQS